MGARSFDQTRSMRVDIAVDLGIASPAAHFTTGTGACPDLILLTADPNSSRRSLSSPVAQLGPAAASTITARDMMKATNQQRFITICNRPRS